MSPGDPKGQQAARHLRRGRASFSASQVRLPVQRQPVRIPVFVQRQHHPVPGETLCPLSLFLLHFAFQTSPPSLLVLQAPSSVRDPSRVVLNDGSCWTIIGVEAVEFTFNQGLACIQTPVTPFPLITGLEVSPRSTQEPEPTPTPGLCPHWEKKQAASVSGSDVSAVTYSAQICGLCIISNHLC